MRCELQSLWPTIAPCIEEEFNNGVLVKHVVKVICRAEYKTKEAALKTLQRIRDQLGVMVNVFDLQSPYDPRSLQHIDQKIDSLTNEIQGTAGVREYREEHSALSQPPDVQERGNRILKGESKEAVKQKVGLLDLSLEPLLKIFFDVGPTVSDAVACRHLKLIHDEMRRRQARALWEKEYPLGLISGLGVTFSDSSNPKTANLFLKSVANKVCTLLKKVLGFSDSPLLITVAREFVFAPHVLERFLADVFDPSIVPRLPLLEDEASGQNEEVLKQLYTLDIDTFLLSNLGFSFLDPLTPEAASEALSALTKTLTALYQAIPPVMCPDVPVHELVQDPKSLRNFLTTLYNFSLQQIFGELAGVPQEVPLDVARVFIDNWFQTADLSKIEMLVAREKNIVYVPKKLFYLSNLRVLDLSKNLICSIPDEIGRLTALAELDFSYNQVRFIPPKIGKLGSLTFLDISHNKIKEIPNEIGEVRELVTLSLGRNELKEVPYEIGRLEKLKALHLEGNCLTWLPETIGTLKSLQRLFLFCNSLTSLPPEIGDLNDLIELDLMYNHISTLPPEIGKLKRLEYLVLSKNELIGFPPAFGDLEALSILYLMDNKLSSIPKEMEKLRNLRDLFMYRSGVSVSSLPEGLKSSSELTIWADEGIWKCGAFRKLDQNGRPIV